MSLYAFDSAGYLGDVATAKGWADLADVLRGADSDVLQRFADEAVTRDPQSLAVALEQFKNVGEELDITRINLLELARTADDILIVSDGVDYSAQYDLDSQGQEGKTFAFNPDQPRHPAGTSEGGQFAPGGQAAGQLETVRRRAYEQQVRQVAREEGIDAQQVEVDWDNQPTFELGGQQFNTAGEAHVHTGTGERIVIYPRSAVAGPVSGLVAHEVAHVKFQKVLNTYSDETQKVIQDPRKHRLPSGREVDIMKPDGSLRSEYAKDYPVYARLQPFEEGRAAELRKDDGVTDYSRSWWRAADKGQVRAAQAHHETIAEIARLRREAAPHRRGMLPVTKLWNDYYDAVQEIYVTQRRS